MLTPDEIACLLSLPDSDLEAWLKERPPNQQAEILKELSDYRTDAEAALESLYEFVKQAWPHVEGHEFVDNWHIKAICEHLEAVTKGTIPKLLINIPPGCSKSLLVSVLWFCWEWARNPKTRWFFASYDQKLATRDSVKCRTLLQSKWYQDRWPVKLTGDQNQKTYYENTEGGWRLATTPNGHGTGEHPDRVVCDDVNNVEQAESQTERESVNRWWDLTMPTRGVSRGVRWVGIMQRLHEEDWSGHVLSQKGWVHICLPMHYEPGRMATTPLGFNDPRRRKGELLTPLFTDKMIEGIEDVLGPYGTAGQMQQRPAPPEGGMFKRFWFEIWQDEEFKPKPIPRHGWTSLVRAWDFGYTKDDGDWTVGVLMGLRLNRLWVLDVVRGQWGSGQRDDSMSLTAGADDMLYGNEVQIWFPQDPAAGKDVAERCAANLAGYRVYYEVVKRSKEARAGGNDSFRSYCWAGHRRGDLVYVAAADWTRKYLDELTVFPNGAHDDMVDASSMAFHKVSKVIRQFAVGA